MKDDRHVITRDTECFQPGDNFTIETALRLKRSPRETLNSHDRVAVGLFKVGSGREPVWLMSDKAHPAVVIGDTESRDEGIVHCAENSYFLIDRVLATDLYQRFRNDASQFISMGLERFFAIAQSRYPSLPTRRPTYKESGLAFTHSPRRQRVGAALHVEPA